MTNDETVEAVALDHPRSLFGYAPGNYMSVCGVCKTKMCYVDKLAFHCFACAMKKNNEAQASIERAALERAAEAVCRSAWRHNGEDAHSKGMDKGAKEQVSASYDAILAIIPTTKEPKS